MAADGDAACPGESDRRRRRGAAAAAGAGRAAWPSSIGCARGRTADSATVPEARYSASAASLAAGRAGGASSSLTPGGPAGG